MAYDMHRMTLKGHESAQCCVWIESDHSIRLMSYRTDVILGTYDAETDKFTLRCTGTYSATTRRHIGWFCKQFFPSLDYYAMKSSAENGEVYEAKLRDTEALRWFRDKTR